jgi:hypothetical protein
LSIFVYPQSHNILPWQGNKNQFSAPLETHLQGVIAHGEFLKLYRTFAGIGAGANLSIYTFLASLEARLAHERRVRGYENARLPHTIYYQVDGGSENANSDLLAICELIVARGLAQRVILTRLPVGHTHEVGFND